jgi:hypothetical protein
MFNKGERKTKGVDRSSKRKWHLRYACAFMCNTNDLSPNQYICLGHQIYLQTAALASYHNINQAKRLGLVLSWYYHFIS